METETTSLWLGRVRSRLYSALDELETPLGRGVNLAIAALVLLSCGIFVAQTYPLPPGVRQRLDGVDQVLLMVFIGEYLLRLWAAKRRLRHFFSVLALIDLLAILPLLVGGSNVSFLRIFRWFRILRLARLIEGRTILGYVTRGDTVVLIRIVTTLVIIIFVFSGLIYQVEHVVQPQVFRTFLDAIYFSVATLTTVGFGDVTPLSQLGRLLTILMIMTGVFLIPWQVGELVKNLVVPTEPTRAKSPVRCLACGLEGHDADAQFCKACGVALPRS